MLAESLVVAEVGVLVIAGFGWPDSSAGVERERPLGATSVDSRVENMGADVSRLSGGSVGVNELSRLRLPASVDGLA